MSEEHSYFKEILSELGLTYEEYEKIFGEFQTTAAECEGPIETVDEWSNQKTRNQRVAFLKGMMFNYFMRKVAQADEIMDEIFQ